MTIGEIGSLLVGSGLIGNLVVHVVQMWQRRQERRARRMLLLHQLECEFRLQGSVLKADVVTIGLGAGERHLDLQSVTRLLDSDVLDWRTDRALVVTLLTLDRLAHQHDRIVRDLSEFPSDEDLDPSRQEQMARLREAGGLVLDDVRDGLRSSVREALEMGRTPRRLVKVTTLEEARALRGESRRDLDDTSYALQGSAPRQAEQEHQDEEGDHGRDPEGQGLESEADQLLPDDGLQLHADAASQASATARAHQ